MKKLIAVSVVILAISASAYAEEPNMKMFQKYSCMACHSFDKKIVGPSFLSVSQKYKGDAKAEEQLMKKVSQGGKGVWGSSLMPPTDARNEHAADTRYMVQYILKYTK